MLFNWSYRNLYIFRRSFLSMHKLNAWAWSFLFVIALALATENIYQDDSLDLQLQVEGEFNLVAEEDPATVEEVTAQLLFYPEQSFRQRLIEVENSGEVRDGISEYRWNNPRLGQKEFGYSALVRTSNQQLQVRDKIAFPLEADDIEGYEEYLLPTETIDSDNPAVIAKANELAEGEDDLFEVTFKLARWVDENVVYDLSTLTAETSQKASWVLQNKQGVCDEMTSLFVAMARSLGIPARFVSGVSYTTSDLFSAPWQPHGWAEVYFPNIGWVSFDITFGEYGYVDVSHIKLRDGFDPKEPATKYEWLARNVRLEPAELDVSVVIAKRGTSQPEAIELEQEILGSEVSMGSHNLIKGILKNNEDYYAATTLSLAVPAELQLIGKNKRTLLLKPNEVTETYWVVKIPSTLDSNYVYTFPSIIYSEKNTSVEDAFTVQSGKPIYNWDDVQELMTTTEEKSYSRKIAIQCDYPRELKLQEEAEVRCTVKNVGNARLEGVTFCVGGVCDVVTLPINQEAASSIHIKGEEAGWDRIVVSAQHPLVDKRISLDYLTLDDPLVRMRVSSPRAVTLGETVLIQIDLEKESFATPRNLTVLWKGAGIEYTWTIEELAKNQTLRLDLTTERLSFNNEMSITALWKDQQGKLFSEKQEITLQGLPASFADRVKMVLNALLNLFST